MNEENNPEMNTWIDPELEARVVAWVAGEASPFEIAELERLVAEKPELAIFKRRIEAVHGLVGEAVRPDAKPLVMSAERRAKLLETFGAPASGDAAEAGTAVFPSAPAKRRARWQRIQMWSMAAAACAIFAVTLITVTKRSYRRMGMVELIEMPRITTEAPAAADDTKIGIQFNLPRQEGIVGGAAAGPMNERLRQIVAAAKSERAAGLAPVSQPAEASQVGQMGQVNGNASVNVGQWHRYRFTAPGLNDAVSNQNQIRDLSSFREDRVGAIGAYDGRLLPPPPRMTLGSDPASVTGPVARNAALLGAGGGGALALGAEREVKLDAFVVAGQKKENTVSASEPIVRLDPLTVSANSDVGFVASSSLAGGRLSTALKDTPVAYSVVTNEFLAGFNNSAPNSVGGGAQGQQAPGFSPAPAQVANRAATESREVRKTAMLKQPSPADAEVDTAKRAATPAGPQNPSTEETAAAQEPVSTFSLHVSDVSFRLAQAALAAAEKGEQPRAFDVRAEEFYNAFDYGDPAPAIAEKVGARIEQSAHPFLQQRNLVRIALKVAASGRGASQPLRLTVLLDTSGSMEREDRQAAVRRALQELVALLGENDRLTLIGFARTPRLLAAAVRGNQAGWVPDLAKSTPAEGGTNLEAALKLGAELARRHQEAGAQNRIVVLTDGAANLGNADPAQLTKMVEELRQQGIAFDACGVGLEGVGDTILEALTRKGDGRYYVLDSAEAADAGFARRLAGAFRPAAENVKVQVRFNPARVGRYRLIGFEQHRLNEADFRNDQVDAAELAAEEAAVALYQVEPLPQGEGELGEVSVRFRDPASGGMVERSWTMTYDARTPAFDRALPSMQLAGTAALLAEKLGERPLASQFKLGDLARVVNRLRGHYANQPRVQELVTMYGTMRRLSRE